MKYLTIFLFSIALHAATYYVSNPGLDSSDGSLGAPWATLQFAVNHVACGDTIMVVANGSFVPGDANLPPLPICGTTTTIQSSALALFAPVGYRTNPATDGPNYGKLSFTSGPLATKPGVWTANEFYLQSPISVDVGTSVFTIANGNGLAIAGLHNGSQVIFTVRSAASSYGGTIFPSIVAPGGLSFFTHYYIVNCSVSPACGTVNSTFQLAATSNGAPIKVTSCGAYCATTVTSDPSGSCTVGQIQYNTSNSTTSDCRNRTTWQTPGFSPFLQVEVVGAAVDVSANTITLSINWGNGRLANGLPVTFSAVDTQQVGTLPEPIVNDLIYYVVNLSGSTFQISLTPHGPPIILTTVGTGATMLASSDLAHNWAFRGLEFAPNGTHTPFELLQLGGVGTETSVSGMSQNMEIDRCFFHDNPPTQAIVHTIAESVRGLYIHDSWIIGANFGEAQVIFGAGSPGPTAIINNFLEASTEVTLYGGGATASATPNANKLFLGNYYYKPPVWRFNQAAGAASGPCLYDATTDPTHVGGEWYLDSMASQNYQCGADNLWHSTGSALPPGIANIAIKNMSEHKGGSYFTHIGNIYNGSFAGAQSGEIFNTSQENDSGAAATDDHNTMMYNVAFNSLQWQTATSQCGATTNLDCPSGPGNDIAKHNLMIVNDLVCGTNFNHSLCGYTARQDTWGGTAVTGRKQGDTKDHLTFWISDSSYLLSPAPITLSPPVDGLCTFPTTMNLVNWKNSIMLGDVLGDCAGQGAGIATYMANSNFGHNVLYKGTSNAYGSVGAGNTFDVAHTAFPAANNTINYVNATGGYGGEADYHLDPTSPYSAANVSPILLSDDGTDLGADIDLVNMTTSGAAAGTPTWDEKAGLRVNPGSTQLVFRYTSPTNEACTATIYSSPARIAGNQVASVADNSANSISDALTRELYVSGLQPSTQYWYKLACGGRVLLVGNLLTRKTGIVPVQFGFDWNSPTPMQYSSSPSMSNPVSLPAATRQFIPVAANSVVYVQAGTAGPITMLIAP
jgi:hypothetical protein